jgi:hypothetical protein
MVNGELLIGEWGIGGGAFEYCLLKGNWRGKSGVSGKKPY